MAFKNYEKAILSILYRSGRPLTTSEVADYSKISRITAMKYIKRLYNEKYLRTKKIGNAHYWRLR